MQLGLARDLLPGVRPEQMKLGHRELKGINDRIEVAKKCVRVRMFRACNGTCVCTYVNTGASSLAVPCSIQRVPMPLV